MAEPEVRVVMRRARHVPMERVGFIGTLFGETRPLQKEQPFGLYWKDPQSGERRDVIRLSGVGRTRTSIRFPDIAHRFMTRALWISSRITRRSYATPSGWKANRKEQHEGIILLSPAHRPRPMLLSMFLPNSASHRLSPAWLITNWQERLVTGRAFSFLLVSREASEEYLESLIPRRYETQYNNWVCKGTCTSEGVAREFFLFSGIHDKGFPWGGDETFSDIGLLLRDASGSTRRFALSDRSVQNLELDFKFKQQGVLQVRR